MFVNELARDLLGPRNGVTGIRETLNRNPLAEFMTGILRPQTEEDLDPDRDDPIPSPLTGQPITGEEGEEQSDDEGTFTTLSPSLNPGSMPSTMGISFRVESTKKLNFKICITWARYIENEETNGQGSTWTREPRHAIVDAMIDVSTNKNKKYLIDRAGNVLDENNAGNAEISLHAYVRPRGQEKYFVSMHVVNEIQFTPFPECPRPKTDHHIFQPQIRVIVPKNLPNSDVTKIIYGEDARSGDDEELGFLYRNRRFYARGHLTSAVWRDVDPEGEYDGQVDYQERADDIPFVWADGQLLSPQERELFTAPDVRTDYIPLYTIAAPELEWKEEHGPSPELNAGTLAEIWEPQNLRKALLPLCNGYENWIQELRANIVEEKRQLCERLIGECETVLKRIKLGIDTVCDEKNPDAALAFCFANKSVDLQSRWARGGQGMIYRPFQLAYVLMCIESIVHKESEYRDFCDLMWVPTGTGKTEAYLALAVFTMAYRRRLALGGDGERTGAGVSIITRYTLRLLTIQQFRRTLSIITAADLLRVDNLSARSRVGWRPKTWPHDENFIWGSSQFSVGLWIGGGATPNHLETKKFWDGLKTSKEPGAIDILSGRDSGESSYGRAEPAQVVLCPCCEAHMSITDSGISGGTTIHLVVSTDATANISNNIANLANQQFNGITITAADSVQHANVRFHTISLTIDHGHQEMEANQVDVMWTDMQASLAQAGTSLELVPFRASRPGYFPRTYLDGSKTIDYDFETFCPNPECPLHVSNDGNHIQWFRGSPTGSIHNRQAKQNNPSERRLDTLQLTDGNALDDVQNAFQESGDYVADRIPIPALIVDDQVYQRTPTIIVSTVDKFARPPFEARASSLFGNVNRFHKIRGYYNTDWRSGSTADPENPKPSYGANNPHGIHDSITRLGRPDLILQDELHLIDGPLGSMVGIYETAVDYLCTNEDNVKVKYIASTATIKKAEEHVGSLFTRALQTFPPHGLFANDRFFVSDKEHHQLADNHPGRLYLGISAPGKGALMPIIRIWARLAQTAWERRSDNILNPDGTNRLDPFWTLTGYFNATRELAGAIGTYDQDIRMRMDQLAGFAQTTVREMDINKRYELSGRMSKAADLPKILQVLAKEFPRDPECADSLFTTSMFGTGVDISRLGLMLINGEPKTTSSYIQSSGRVGRSSGGLVIALLRPSRPRDLSHYEYFTRHHRQLHRFVEPPTVYPFASGVMERALGPVGVFMLRHGESNIPWMRKDTGAREMDTQRNHASVNILSDIIRDREASQPETRRLPNSAPASQRAGFVMAKKMDDWNDIASRETGLLYYEFSVIRGNPMHPVVLGDFKHQGIDPVTGDHVSVVYRNAQQSLRDMEPETDFQTS